MVRQTQHDKQQDVLLYPVAFINRVLLSHSDPQSSTCIVGGSKFNVMIKQHAPITWNSMCFLRMTEMCAEGNKKRKGVQFKMHGLAVDDVQN